MVLLGCIRLLAIPLNIFEHLIYDVYLRLDVNPNKFVNTGFFKEPPINVTMVLLLMVITGLMENCYFY